jgi:Uroporphyrinogen-III synthase HemD
MGDHIASLVRKYGGTPFSAPALAEFPDVDPAHIRELIRDWNSARPDIFIFQTGVGTRALFAATDLFEGDTRDSQDATQKHEQMLMLNLCVFS